jgi:outer membrane protein
MQRLTRFALALAVAAAPITTAAAADAHDVDRIAVVEVQRCLLETNEGKKAKEELERTMVKGQAKIDKKAEALGKRYKDLMAKGSMLSEAEIEKRQADLMREQAELDQLSAQLQEDVAEKEALLTEKIYKNVAEIVTQIALEEKLQAVLVRSDMTVMFVDSRLDLTNRVIIRYDKEHPGK